jgi:hypothetical protein
MSESRKFPFCNGDWVCSIEFFSDRIEYTWDAWGLGKDTGKKVIQRQELVPELSEATSGAGSLAMKEFRFAGIYLILAMFSYVLLPTPWRYSTYLFLLAFAVLAYRGVKVFGRKHWIRISRKNGSLAVGIQATKWTDEEREEFRRFYKEWISRPEWVDGLT